jgi:hypothetical protein
MLHGDFSPQYQRYGEKILVGSYLKWGLRPRSLWTSVRYPGPWRSFPFGTRSGTPISCTASVRYGSVQHTEYLGTRYGPTCTQRMEGGVLCSTYVVAPPYHTVAPACVARCCLSGRLSCVGRMLLITSRPCWPP